MIKNLQGAGVGLFFGQASGVVWNRSGGTLAIGACVMFDLKNTQAETNLNAAIGADDYIFSNVILPTTAGIGTLSGAGGDPGYAFGFVDSLLEDAGADNKKVNVTVVGFVMVQPVASTAMVGGEPIRPANGVATVTNVATAGVRPIGRLMNDVASASPAALTLALVDGWSGCLTGLQAAS